MSLKTTGGKLSMQKVFMGWRVMAIVPLLVGSNLVSGCALGGNSCQDLAKKASSMMVRVGGIEEITSKTDIAAQSLTKTRLEGDPKGESGVVIPTMATAIQEIESLSISDADLKTKQQDYVSKLKTLQTAMTDWQDPVKQVAARKVISDTAPAVNKLSQELATGCTP
jgi:hypothetical protein